MSEDSLGAQTQAFAWVYADTHDRSVFNDFGKDFACVDPTGEQPQTGMVVEIDEVS
jgi:hypothetical protein